MTDSADRARLRRVATGDLSADEITTLRELLVAAFGTDDEEEAFDENDWQHALGGVHFVLDVGSRILAHASVVERQIHIDGRPLRTGYVEAVATAPGHERKGYGTTVMRDVGAYIDERFELGALGTGSHGFYHRLGWQTWQGSSSVRTTDGTRRTMAEDGHILVLRTPSSPAFDLTEPITCEWRPGDVW